MMKRILNKDVPKREQVKLPPTYTKTRTKEEHEVPPVVVCGVCLQWYPYLSLRNTDLNKYFTHSYVGTSLVETLCAWFTCSLMRL